MRTSLVRNLCLVTMSTFLTLPALAANILVTTTADELYEDGECSLREAVISANQDDAGLSGCTSGNGVDVIIVPAGTYVLDNSSCDDNFAFAGYDPAECDSLDITDNTRIEGDPNGGTIIDGDYRYNYDAGIFFIHSPHEDMDELIIQDEDFECVQGIEVTLKDMTVQHGSSMYGGGITIWNYLNDVYDKAILENMIVRNNDTGYDYYGYGGGIYSEGFLIVNNSQIIENGSSDGYGGGLYSYNWRYYYHETCQYTSVITDTIIDNNKYDMMGGNDGEPEAGSGYGYPIAYGGGVYNDDGALTIRSTANGVCSISGNEAYYNGGGIYNEHILNIEGCTLNNNIADYALYDPEEVGYDGYGGAIYGQYQEHCVDGPGESFDEDCEYVNSITISDSTISGNKAGYEAGGVGSFAPIYIRRTSITENEGGWYGGVSFWGHYHYGYDENQNYTSYYTGDALLEKSTVANNISHGWAGGIYNKAEFRCVNSTISGNEAPLGWGGGFVQDTSMDTTPAVFRNCTITGNMVDHLGPDELAQFIQDYYEGGMYACEDNAEYEHGGGIYIEQGTVKLANTILAANIDGDACVFEGGGEVELATDLVTAPDCWVYECNEPTAQAVEGGGSGGDVVCAAIESAGYNLVGTDQGCMYPAGAPGDKVGTVDSEIDPLLGPLSDNGGTTRTHALMDESPALDSGNPDQLGGDADEACPSDDQRFEVRPEIGKPDGSERCDIGAYERLAERDCLDNPWGVAVLDRCGVCSGDGDSCLDCTDANIVTQQFTLDGGGLELKSIANKTARRLRRLGKKKAAKNTRLAATELYNQMWNLSWALPSIVTTCANTEFCVEVSNASEIDQYVSSSDSLRQVVVDGVAKISKAKGKKRAGRKYRLAAEAQHESNVLTASSVPTSTSVCS